MDSSHKSLRSNLLLSGNNSVWEYLNFEERKYQNLMFNAHKSSMYEVYVASSLHVFTGKAIQIDVGSKVGIMTRARQSDKGEFKL